MPILTLYLATLVPFLILDALMIGFVIGPLFTEALGPLLATPPRWVPAGLFYLGYPAAVVALVSRPALKAGTRALWPAALLGLTAYGTYELTNLALLAAWTPAMTALDMVWGTVLTAVSASAGLAIARRLGQGRR